MSDRERADTALVRRGLAASREKAQAMIMAGEVYAGERKINKSSEMIGPEEQLTVRSSSERDDLNSTLVFVERPAFLRICSSEIPFFSCFFLSFS